MAQKLYTFILLFILIFHIVVVCSSKYTSPTFGSCFFFLFFLGEKIIFLLFLNKLLRGMVFWGTIRIFPPYLSCLLFVRVILLRIMFHTPGVVSLTQISLRRISQRHFIWSTLTLSSSTESISANQISVITKTALLNSHVIYLARERQVRHALINNVIISKSNSHTQVISAVLILTFTLLVKFETQFHYLFSGSVSEFLLTLVEFDEPKVQGGVWWW